MKETKTFIQWLREFNVTGEIAAMKAINKLAKHQHEAMFKNNYYVYKSIAANPRYGKALYCTNCDKWVSDCRCLEPAFK